MDIENCNICMPCAPTDSERELLDAMSSCSVENQPLTIYIASLLERLTKEMILTKEKDSTSPISLEELEIESDENNSVYSQLSEKSI